MSQLIILQGIQGSGKSTAARSMVQQDKSNKTIIVNRDSIRSMLGKYWVPSREKLVTNYEHHMIQTGLKSGYDVIVDATNLNDSTLRKLINIGNDADVSIIFHKLIINPYRAYARILWRTLKKGRYIPFKVIKDFYNRYKHTIGLNAIKN